MYLVTHYPVNSLNNIIQKLSLRNFPTNVIQCLVIGTDKDMTGQQRCIHLVSACSYHKLLSYRVHGTMYIVHGSSQTGVATEWVGQQEESLVPNWTRFWICVDEIGNYFKKKILSKRCKWSKNGWKWWRNLWKQFLRSEKRGEWGFWLVSKLTELRSSARLQISGNCCKKLFNVQCVRAPPIPCTNSIGNNLPAFKTPLLLSLVTTWYWTKVERWIKHCQRGHNGPKELWVLLTTVTSF